MSLEARKSNDLNRRQNRLRSPMHGGEPIIFSCWEMKYQNKTYPLSSKSSGENVSSGSSYDSLAWLTYRWRQKMSIMII